MSKQADSQYQMPTKQAKRKKKRGCKSGCGRSKSFEERIRQGRSN